MKGSICSSILKNSLGHSRSEASDIFVVSRVLNNFGALSNVPLVSDTYGQLKRRKQKR